MYFTQALKNHVLLYGYVKGEGGPTLRPFPLRSYIFNAFTPPQICTGLPAHGKLQAEEAGVMR